MLKVSSKILWLGCVLAACLSAPAWAANGSPDEATALYLQGDFKHAYKRYEKAAKSGDTFARFRLSYMYAMGLGTKQDPVKSLAWAILAEENGPPALAGYREAVSELVPEKHRRKAQRLTDNYRRRWDIDNSAKGDCTGSRLRSACGGGSHGKGKPIAWAEDRSEDPVQVERVEELNRKLLERTFDRPALVPDGSPAPADSGSAR